MSDLKQVVAENITNLRCANQLTQFQLGEKINYSDKAISRWERAEAIPDARVLLQLSELFGVSVDYLLHSHEGETAVKQVKPRIEHKNIIWLSVIGVWTLALFTFIVLYLCERPNWIVFMYAAPVSLIVYLVLNSIWGNKKRNLYIISAFIWSILASVYFSVLLFAHLNWWIIFLLGVPAQIMACLGFRIRKKPVK